ncbi:MAG: DUF2490 domain-containing protein [Saprospiraceae bacterium]
MMEYFKQIVSKAQLVLFLICVFVVSGNSQNRLSDHNTIGWYSINGNFKLTPNWSITSEFHYRRSELLTHGMQNLFRNSINYQLNPKLQVRAGYAYITNVPYGVYPLNGFGKSFKEHRTFQSIITNDKIGIVELSHRWMLEQRWIGRYSNASLEKEDQFPFFNRMRYMARAQMPLGKKVIENKTPYIAVYDEVMIGFGKNVNENIFDQNRIGLLVGYRFSTLFRLEGGYFNHILQLAREVDNKNVFQYNQGIIMNAWFNIDWSTK